VEKFIRPKAEVLSEESLIPEKNLIYPPPNVFTHKLIRSQPFYFTSMAQASPPDGEIPEGKKVVLLRHEGSNNCSVVDERGLYVEIEFDSLKKL
jgi:hypothetical protein